MKMAFFNVKVIPIEYCVCISKWNTYFTSLSVTWEDVILSKSYVGKNLLDTDYERETIVGTCAVLGTRNGNTVTNVELDSTRGSDNS